MIKEGQCVYYLVNGLVQSGNVINIEVRSNGTIFI